MLNEIHNSIDEKESNLLPKNVDANGNAWFVNN
jgi:hypothetical protein